MEKCNCYKCNHTYEIGELKKYNISQRNFTSMFYYMDADIYLCDECSKQIKSKWFNRDLMVQDDLTYKNEEELYKFICSFPLPYQQKIFNESYPEEYRLDIENWYLKQFERSKLEGHDFTEKEIEDIRLFYAKEDDLEFKSSTELL